MQQANSFVELLTHFPRNIEFYFILYNIFKTILKFIKDICLKTFEELNFDRSHSCPECRTTSYQKYALTYHEND
jgi:hypothetical protein